MKFQSWHRKALLLVFAIYIASFTAWATMDPIYFPIERIKPGMRGVGYTVVSGTKVEKFDVRFRKVLSGSGSVRNLIFVEVSGKILQPFGGIAAGMSGSPVFVDDKLVGAISYGFPNSDPRYGLVTPIQDMLRLWSNNQQDEDGQKLVWSDGDYLGVKGIVLGDSVGQQGWLSARPVTTPLCVAGLGERTYQSLITSLPMMHLHPMRISGGTYQNEESPELMPGSAVGVQLVRGDFQVTAIGTLTWIVGDRFLAFGHPFMNRGNVDYYVTAADISQVMPSSRFPFKMGEPLGIVGKLTQDRGAGIAGVFMKEPDVVPVRVRVSEAGRGSAEEFRFWAVHDENLLRGLAVAGGLEAIDRFLDRIGSGTSKVQMRIVGHNFGTIERTNVFYGQDVATASLKDFNRLLEILLGNEYNAVRVFGMDLEIEIDPVRKTARVEEAKGTGNRKLMVGESMAMDIQLQPYRGKKEKVPVKITLPKDMAPGRYILSIRGGNFQTAEEEKEGKKAEEVFFGSNVKDLKGLINEFLSIPTNNMLVIEAIPLVEEGADDSKNLEAFSPVRQWAIPTDYYLTGETQVNIEIATGKTS